MDGCIHVDPCMVEELRLLWSHGVMTYGCCCGHGERPAFVNVEDNPGEKTVDILTKLGYEMVSPPFPPYGRTDYWEKI